MTSVLTPGKKTRITDFDCAGNTDIQNGNVKLILGLIWSLIAHYQLGASNFPPKKLMLAWLKVMLMVVWVNMVRMLVRMMVRIAWVTMAMLMIMALRMVSMMRVVAWVTKLRATWILPPRSILIGWSGQETSSYEPSLSSSAKRMQKAIFMLRILICCTKPVGGVLGQGLILIS